jgi:hypothetical protein
MGAVIVIKQGTGTKCRICNKPITKNQSQIGFSGWNASAQIHSEVGDCNILRRVAPGICRPMGIRR